MANAIIRNIPNTITSCNLFPDVLLLIGLFKATMNCLCCSSF